MKDWRVGMSKALTTPSAVARPITLQIEIVWVQVRIASANACSIERVWVNTTVRRRSVRSATTPAYNVNTSTPREPSAEVEGRIGQRQHEPAERHRLHPGADQRCALAGDEQPEVAVRQGAGPERRPSGRFRHASSSSVRGQSCFNSRESDRSASSRPPV